MFAKTEQVTITSQVTERLFSRVMWEEIWLKIAGALPSIGAALVVLFAFWLAASVARRVVLRVGEARGIDSSLTRSLSRGARAILLIFGGISALGTAGVDVAALVAGMGLTGFALGFALKDIISNSLAGMLILIYKPYERDDHIKVKAFEGKVLEVDLRYTILDAQENRIFVPNSVLFTDAISVMKRR